MINSEMYRLGSAPSSIRELFEYGKKLKKEIGDENVFDFSLGNPSTPPPQTVLSEMKKILTESEPCALHGYSSAQGDPATRKAIANDLATRYGAKISPDKIYMTCGAAASLCITVRALANSERNEFIVQAPFFPEYKVFTENNGGKLLVAEADTENFELNIPEIKKLISERTQGIIINSPNNPSGVIYSKKSLTELALLLSEKSKEYGHPIYIISDEPYRELTYGKRVPYIPDIYPDTVICYSYSKSLSLPGERIGYIALPDGVSDIDELYFAICGAGRSLGYVCAPTFMQKVVGACTGQVSDLTVYRKNRDNLYAALTVMGYTCVIPDGAFYLFVKAPGGDAVKFSEKAKELGLLLVPGDGFGCPGYLRISYCVSEETVRRSLPAFGRAIDLFQ
ncbi:MAG: pyridoxal phosphate-dependent aminotransferase [Clostridia bacterium]|nr:pyridoxal phosphate-dependent aminotransferase [Clostridia bacterium]